MGVLWKWKDQPVKCAQLGSSANGVPPCLRFFLPQRLRGRPKGAGAEPHTARRAQKEWRVSATFGSSRDLFGLPYNHLGLLDRRDVHQTSFVDGSPLAGGFGGFHRL